MYYIATVAFETGSQDKDGNMKTSKTKIPVQVDAGIEEAIVLIAKYHEGVTYGYSIVDIKKFPVETIIDKANYPALYV